MSKNVYIHIPFCQSKCNYCSFVSTPAIEYKEEYLKSLMSEIKFHYKYEQLDTLYFGGGTPSLLKLDEIEELMLFFNINKNTEITFEINPEGITKDYLICLNHLDVNRLSIGAQTFNDKILNELGRRHSSPDIEHVVDMAKKALFKNISIDLMYGLPSQTLDDFKFDIKKALELDVNHISLYGLKIEKHCKFHSNKPENLPDDDMQAEMYRYAVEELTKNGFEHYEISNFAKKGFESKHNLNYWNNNEYYGFGAAAHGYTNNVRYANLKEILKYIDRPFFRPDEHQLSPQEKLEEEIFLGFRKTEGIDTKNINIKYDIDFDSKYADILEKYLKTNHLKKTEKGYALTLDGLLVSNVILAEFIA